MISYYSLKKSENNFRYLIAYISVCLVLLLHSKFQSVPLDVAFIIIFYYGYTILSPNNSIEMVRFIFMSASLTIFYMIFVLFSLSWVFNYPILYNIGIISDEKMLVLMTFTYVILTYKIMRSNVEIFQYQRMPNIVITSSLVNNMTLIVKNVSDYPVIDLTIQIEIVHPIPKTTFEIIRMWFMRHIDILICSYEILKKYNVCAKHNPNYHLVWKSEKLESNDQIDLTIINDVEKKLHLYLHDDKIYGIKTYYSEEEILFDVIIKCEYASQDNLYLKNPIFNLFKYKSNREGIHILTKSGDAIKIR